MNGCLVLKCERGFILWDFVRRSLCLNLMLIYSMNITLNFRVCLHFFSENLQIFADFFHVEGNNMFHTWDCILLQPQTTYLNSILENCG